jgi:hypothetical protein
VSVTQRFAWYNLAVVTVSAVTVAALVPWLGPIRATGGFGFLGFLGLSPIFFRRKRGECVFDERDQQIWQRAVAVGYATFWVGFVAVCTGASVFYGSGDTIPIFVLQWAVWGGLTIIMAVMSVAILVQYGRGGPDGV